MNKSAVSIQEKGVDYWEKWKREKIKKSWKQKEEIQCKIGSEKLEQLAEMKGEKDSHPKRLCRSWTLFGTQCLYFRKES